MISCLTLRAAKLNDLFCPGSTTSSLIKLLKSTRPFIAFFLVFLIFFSFFLLFLSTIQSIESFFDSLLHSFGFLLVSSILISLFLFHFGALIFPFFGGFISVLIFTFNFVFLLFCFFGSVSWRTICNFFCCNCFCFFG